MDFERQIDRAFELVQQGEPETARTICLELKSKFGVTANLAFLLGAIDFKLADLSSAQTHLEQAVQRDPDNAQYSKMLGNVVLRRGRMLRDLGRNDEARGLLGRYCQSIDHVSYEVTLAAWILPVIPGSQTEMTDARLRYEAAVEGLATRTGVIDEDRLLGAGTNFMAAYQAVDDHRFQEIIAGFYRRNCPALSYVAPHVGEVSPHPQTKIRIGFVSVNFNNHTVGKLYRGIIAKLDRTKFEVSVFGAGDDEISQFIQNNCDAYFNLPESLPLARNLISGQRLDILFYADIGMDPLTYFLGFARLARMQCVGWGHGVSTGLDTIDHFISSVGLEEPAPERAQTHYTENLVRLSQPPTYLYKPQTPPADAGPDLSFADGGAIYTCPQTLFKILPDFDDLLIDILRRDPTGVAIFIEGLRGWSDALKRRWRAIDGSAAARVHFLPRLDQNDFLGLLRASTVILDTIHFSGGVSSAEALAQGTPIVTWPKSPLLVGRATHAYLREIEVLDGVADSAEDYVEKAVRLGIDRDWRETVAGRIRDRGHLLFERREVIEELEDFFVSNFHGTL